MLTNNLEVMQSDIDLAASLSARHPEHRQAVFTAVLTLALFERLHADGGEPPVPTAGKRKPMTPTEFFARLKPSQDVDRVLGAAYFVEAYNGLKNFTVHDLEECLMAGKIKVPSNPSLAALQNAKKGLMAEAEKHGRTISWYLTQTGVDHVERALQQGQ